MVENAKWLSEAINISDIETGMINLIEANCGAGKTYFALKYLPEQLYINRHDCLYLTDTTNLRQQILNDKEYADVVQKLTNDIIDNPEEHWCDNKMAICTYARFGMELQYDERKLRHYKLIIMDEAHSCVEYSGWGEDGNYCAYVLDYIENIESEVTVLALTATPSRVYARFDRAQINKIIPTSPLKEYEIDKKEFYGDLSKLLQQLPKTSRGMIYIQSISIMETYIEQARTLGFKANGFWSVRNVEHQMTQEQQDLREYIINNQSIPNDLDILFINKSSETGINIRTKLDFVIVHNTNEDTVIQARNRIRNDIPILYVKYQSENTINCMYIDLKIIDEYVAQQKKLYTEDKKSLCQYLELKDNWGRLLGWSGIKRILYALDYEIENKRSDHGSKSYSIIKKVQRV